MKSTNPYRPSLVNEQPVRERIKLPLSFPLLAILDIISAGVLGFFAFLTLFGFKSRTFANVFVAAELIAASFLASSLFATAIGLLLKRPSAWVFFLVSQCLLAFWILFTYLGHVYVLIDTWGAGNMMWSGGDPTNLTIATLIFVVMQTLALIPIRILLRHRPNGRVESID